MLDELLKIAEAQAEAEAALVALKDPTIEQARPVVDRWRLAMDAAAPLRNARTAQALVKVALAAEIASREHDCPALDEALANLRAATQQAERAEGG